VREQCFDDFNLTPFFTFFSSLYRRNPLEPPVERCLMSRDIQGEFTVKYGVIEQEINPSTPIHSLVDITTIAQEVNRESGSGASLEIKVKALKPGSLLVDLHL
jgi:hypothetical protein